MLAHDEAEAIEQLDEVVNAEGCPIVELKNLQVHFTLTARTDLKSQIRQANKLLRGRAFQGDHKSLPKKWETGDKWLQERARKR